MNVPPAVSGSALYPRLLGTSWSGLPSAVRRCHLRDAATRVRGSGTFQIRHGNTFLAGFVARVLRMPPAATAVPVQLLITSDKSGERWLRTFGTCPLVTTQREHRNGLLAERTGIMEFWFRLEVVPGGLRYRQIGAALRLGRGSIALLSWLSPQVEAREEAVEGDPNQTQVHVQVTLPLVGLLLSYEGCIRAQVVPTS